MCRKPYTVDHVFKTFAGRSRRNWKVFLFFSAERISSGLGLGCLHLHSPVMNFEASDSAVRTI